MPPPAPPPGFQRATTGPAPPAGFQRKPWIQVEQDAPIEASLGDSLMQSLGEWGDIAAGIPGKVRASAASTVAGMHGAELAKLREAQLAGVQLPNPDVRGLPPAQAAGVTEGYLLEELGIARAASEDLQPTPGATIAQRGLETAAISAVPSAAAIATGLLTRNPAAAASTSASFV